MTTKTNGSKAPTRVYEVRDTSMLDAHPPRLIEARDQGQVRAHLQKPYEISVPDTLRVVDLIQSKGIKIERAGAEDDAQEVAIRG